MSMLCFKYQKFSCEYPMKHRLYFLLLLMFSFATFADEDRGEARERVERQGFVYGVGLAVRKEIYKGFDQRVIPLPTIGYRGEKLTVLAPFASYDVASFESIKFSLRAAPRFQGFDESDSFIFEGMEERKFSMDSGVGVQYEKNNWRVDVGAMFDVLNRSNGYELHSRLSRVYSYGPFFFEPRVTVSYLDANHVDYYYGVTSDEMNSFRSQYLGASTVNTSFNFSISTPIFFGGFSSISVGRTWFGSGITDSPLVEDNADYSFRLAFAKYF
ncbi:MAG: outer membrane protein [Flavobacteriales bacterium]|jgi:outer membrane protein